MEKFNWNVEVTEDRGFMATSEFVTGPQPGGTDPRISDASSASPTPLLVHAARLLEGRICVSGRCGQGLSHVPTAALIDVQCVASGLPTAFSCEAICEDWAGLWRMDHCI
ncbi:unnamed protein product [Ostreobium quekettii]|uniref:Uncharacterized protein n=1 Tax=Ostreobium quekettii TaxID=121088 RepID=A0A8S1IPL1_9CHLO|nr:unnamed protein product [Ostreobium quekettii]